MLSVIVACRNHGKWLPSCIRSLQAQIETPVEIVVCFDADYDSYLFLKKNLDNFDSVKMFATEGHVGCYRALNVGLNYAGGRYISFCGADDKWHIARATKMLEELTQGDSDVVNTFYTEIDEDDNEIKQGFKGLGGVFCYKSELIKDLGGFEPWLCSADSDLFYRAQKVGAKPGMVKDHLYLYRQHGRQLTKHPATKFGSVRRQMYENRWHDSRTKISHPLVPHRRLQP